MPAPSLRQLATASAVKYAKFINDVGNLPYALVRPILMKVDNPERLHSMELLSPQLAQEDQELWLELIKRDIPQWHTYDLPDKSDDWYGIYRDLRDAVQRELDADAAKLKMAIDGIKSERAHLQPKVMKELPRRTRGSRAGPSWRGGSDAKKKAAIFAPQKRNTALAVPTKQLSTRATQIKKAPRSLIEEHRRPMEQSIARRENHSAFRGKVLVPGKTASASASSRAVSTVGASSSLAEREARLKAIAAGKPVTSSKLEPPSAATATVATKKSTADNTRDSSASAREAPAPAKRPIPKRRAPSPPAQSHPRSPVKFTAMEGPADRSNNAGREPSARPAAVRKRTEVDIFLRPKKRRVV